MKNWLQELQKKSAIAVIRSPKFALGLQLARAVAAGGIESIEIAWNSDRAAATIAQLRQEMPDCWIGTGTILTENDLQEAIAAGAQFIFSPHLNPQLIAAARQAEIAIVPGALSPTEIVTAWQAGATAVKVFPIQAVGGADYIKALQGPLGQIPLIPTGGVTLENARSFLQAGAVAVGLSSQLFPAALVAQEDWDAIAQRAAIAARECS